MHPLVLVPLSLIELVYRPWLFLRAIPPSLTCRSLPCELIPSFSLKFLVVETVCETRLQFCGFSLAYARSLIRFVNQALWSSTLLFISILFVQPTAHFVSCIWHCIIILLGGGVFFFPRTIPVFRFFSNWTCFFIRSHAVNFPSMRLSPVILLSAAAVVSAFQPVILPDSIEESGWRLLPGAGVDRNIPEVHSLKLKRQPHVVSGILYFTLTLSFCRNIFTWAFFFSQGATSDSKAGC